MPVLDTIPGDVAAWSLRKVRDDYTGPAIRARRSSDNDELDIGFRARRLDAAALLAFVGVSHGYVSRWYDQGTADRYAEQPIGDYQPILVESGQLVISATGHPAVRFGVNNDVCLVVNGNAPIAEGGTARSYHAAFQQDAAELRPAVFCEGQNSNLRTFACLSEYAIRFNGANILFDSAADLGRVEVATWGASGGTVSDGFARRNGIPLGVAGGSGSGSLDTQHASYIGYYSPVVGNGSFLGRINEVIAVPALLSTSQIAAIEVSQGYWRKAARRYAPFRSHAFHSHRIGGVV